MSAAGLLAIPSGEIAGPRPPVAVEDACEALVRAQARAVILVEGWSDQAALEALARRRGIDLGAEAIAIVPMGGITNIGKFTAALGPPGLGLGLAGLYDVGEEPHVLRSLRRLGLGGVRHREDASHAGFFVCDADLEDELIRALGTAAVERVLDDEGELESFRIFQGQPAQRGRAADAQLRRFMGTRARRKIRYGALLVEALPLDRVPAALDAVLARHRR